MKVDIEYVARILAYKGLKSDSKNVEDDIQELLLVEMKAHLDKLTEQVIEKMQELEHPEPRNVEEYNERYGLGEGE